MANFGTYFLKNFSPNFANTFNTSYRYGLSQQEEERKRREELKAQQEQQSILSQLMTGTKPTLNYAGKYAPLLQQDVPLTNNQKFEIYSKLTPQNQNAYEYWQKQNEPQKKDLYQFDGDLYERNNDGSLGNIIKSKEVKPEEPKPIFLKDEVIGDKIRALKGYEDPNADTKDPNVRTINGKKYRVTDYVMHDIYEKKTDNNGEYFDFSKDTKKALGDYYKRQQELKAITNAGFGNRTKNGKEDEPTFRDELDKHNKVYLEAVRNVMRDSAKNWYNELYNAGGSNIDPRDYLSNLKDSFINGQLGMNPDKPDNYDIADFNSLLEQFKAIYGFDPREKYGQFLEAIQ